MKLCSNFRSSNFEGYSFLDSIFLKLNKRPFFKAFRLSSFYFYFACGLALYLMYLNWRRELSLKIFVSRAISLHFSGVPSNLSHSRLSPSIKLRRPCGSLLQASFTWRRRCWSYCRCLKAHLLPESRGSSLFRRVARFSWVIEESLKIKFLLIFNYTSRGICILVYGKSIQPFNFFFFFFIYMLLEFRTFFWKLF